MTWLEIWHVLALGHGLWHCLPHMTHFFHLLFAKRRVPRCRKRVESFLQTCGWSPGWRAGCHETNEGVCCVIFCQRKWCFFSKRHGSNRMFMGYYWDFHDLDWFLMCSDDFWSWFLSQLLHADLTVLCFVLSENRQGRCGGLIFYDILKRHFLWLLAVLSTGALNKHHSGEDSWGVRRCLKMGCPKSTGFSSL